MTVRKIVVNPHEVLRRKAHKVTSFDKDLETLINDMVETMRAAPGVGLAAPQVGVSQRVIVVEYSEDPDKRPKLYAVVNPEIIKPSDETEVGIEACLSIPGLVGEVERNIEITVKAQNRMGKPIKFKASGWMARIFQHEIDHLDGILYPDRATRVWQPTEEEMAEIPD